MARFVILGMLFTLLTACGVHTRTAVRNETGEPVTATLVAPDGEKVEFGEIQPKTTSAFAKVSFSQWKGLVLKLADRELKVELKPKEDNTIVVPGEGESADVKSEYNKENEWW